MACVSLLGQHLHADLHGPTRTSTATWSHAHHVPHPVAHGALRPQRATTLPQQHSRLHQAPAASGAVAADSGACGVQLGWSIGFTSKFSLGAVLGRGSWGTVHEATHKVTGASFAVKVLNKAGKHGMQLEAISREVETWQQAQGSKYVARLEGLYEDEEHAYIVQELCAGGDLKAFLDAHGCTTELQAAAIMRGVLDVLVECHRRSICYGDLKPANIMFSQQQQQPWLAVRAVDFGCSRVSAKGRPLTQCCGSPLYMAPEMALQRFGVGVDVWAAGVMMYQMLTGRLPFWRNKSLAEVSRLPPYEILAAVRCSEVQFPHDVWGGLSPEARDLVSRMLDRNPASRITAEEALQHPWLSSLLGYTPAPSGSSSSSVEWNNVVDFPRASRQQQQQHVQQQLSPGGHGSGAGVGPLSPSRHQPAAAAGACCPLTRRLSGEMASGMLVPDRFRVPVSALVPAAE